MPDEACEAMRDLLRARDDAKRAQLQQHFEHAAQNRVIEEYLHTVNEASARIQRYDRLLAELVPQTEFAALIKVLQAFRGIRLLTAASVAFGLCDLRRFSSPKKLIPGGHPALPDGLPRRPEPWRMPGLPDRG